MFRYLFVLAGIVLLIISYNSDVDYTKSIDFRAKQYHPATIINMSQREHCNDTSCWLEYEVALELTDLSIREGVGIVAADFNSYKLGDIIYLERHLTDPKIIAQNSAKSSFAVLGWIFIIFGFVIMAVKD